MSTPQHFLGGNITPTQLQEGLLARVKITKDNANDLIRAELQQHKEKYEALKQIYGLGEAFSPYLCIIMGQALAHSCIRNKAILVNASLLEQSSSSTQNSRRDHRIIVDKRLQCLFFKDNLERAKTPQKDQIKIGLLIHTPPAFDVCIGNLPPSLWIRQHISSIVKVPEPLISILEKVNLLEEFAIHYGDIINKVSHDYLHALTNPGFMSKGGGYMVVNDRSQAEQHFAGRKIRNNYEEDFVLTLHATIFDHLRAQEQSAFVTSLSESVKECSKIITTLAQHGGEYQQWSIFLQNHLQQSLGRLIDPSYLGQYNVRDWNKALYTAPTQKLAQFFEKGEPFTLPDILGKMHLRLYEHYKSLASFSTHTGKILACAAYLAERDISPNDDFLNILNITPPANTQLDYDTKHFSEDGLYREITSFLCRKFLDTHIHKAHPLLVLWDQVVSKTLAVQEPATAPKPLINQLTQQR